VTVGIRRALRIVDAGPTLSASAPQVGATQAGWPFPSVSAANPTTSTDLAGLSGWSLPRDTAMSIPAFRQGVNLISGTCGSFPLRVTRPDYTEVPLPAVLAQPDPDEPASVTYTKVFTDLVLHPYAWLYVTERYAPNLGQPIGWPKRAIHLPAEQVRITEQRRVEWNGIDITADAIRFDSPHAPGALHDGQRILRTAILIEDATRRFAVMDIPAGYLKQTGGPELLDSEVQSILDAWETARATRNTAYLSQTVEYQNPAFDPKALQLVEARAANAVDIARLLNLPPVYVNADAGSSLTYSTTESMGKSLLNTSLVPYLTAVAGRLSMGDITPQGQTVRFSFDAFLRTDLQARASAYSQLIPAGVYTVDEARAMEQLPPLPPDQTPETSVEDTP
jgi:phage portal protein BeeE